MLINIVSDLVVQSSDIDTHDDPDNWWMLQQSLLEQLQQYNEHGGY